MEFITYQLIQANIRIELFISLLVSSLAIVVLGFLKSNPALILIGGLFFAFTPLVVSTIQMGNLVTSSTISGSTTTYTYTPDNFSLTSTIQMVFVLIGAVICLFSLVVYNSKNGP